VWLVVVGADYYNPTPGHKPNPQKYAQFPYIRRMHTSTTGLSDSGRGGLYYRRDRSHAISVRLGQSPCGEGRHEKEYFDRHRFTLICGTAMLDSRWCGCQSQVDFVTIQKADLVYRFVYKVLYTVTGFD
jgi:hypothetical protein